MTTARLGVDPRRIVVGGGLLVTTALFGAFLVGVRRAIADGGRPVTGIVFTLAVFAVAGLFFLSTAGEPTRRGSRRVVAAGGALLGVGLALLVPPAWSALPTIQLLAYPFVLVWILALAMTGEGSSL